MRLRFVNSNRQGHGRLRFGFDDDLDPECRWQVLKPQGTPHGQVPEHRDIARVETMPCQESNPVRSINPNPNQK
jgi:hypothetical protein